LHRGPFKEGDVCRSGGGRHQRQRR
jgi:hypothetical protein